MTSSIPHHLCLLALCGLLLGAAATQAHDHVEVGVDPDDSERLAFDGVSLQLALLVPAGEFFSGYLPEFPGGDYTSELTFSVEGTASVEIPQSPTRIRVAMVSVGGPPGGELSFWEVGGVTPAFTRPSGWTASPGDEPAFEISEPGVPYGHIHGRAFTFSVSGTYTVAFRADDIAGVLASSELHVMTFRALHPPQLTLRREGANVVLSFPSRLNLTYEIQATPDLRAETWGTISAPIDGTGGLVEFSEPFGTSAERWFRLIEYQ